MNGFEKILTIECSVLVIAVVIALILYNLKKQTFENKNNQREKSFEKKCIILPPNKATFVELERHVEQLSREDLGNEEITDDCTILDETKNIDEVGRLYFSLIYKPQECALTIKLIRGENLPTIFQDASKAYVNVQIICHKPEGKSSMAVKRSKVYQRTYTFYLQPRDFLSHFIYFEVSRFDRFSRKYDIAYVVVALSELQAEIVELNREKYFAKDIIRNWNMARHHRPEQLWSKVSDAVRAGLFEERCRLNPKESLQWDPFLIVRRCEFSGSDTCTRHSHNQNNSSAVTTTNTHRTPNCDEQELLQGNVPRWYTDTLHWSNKTPLFTINNTETEHEVYSLPQQTSSANQDFYRLVHSPSLARKTPVIPITSWSIPETFRLSPQPSRIQKHGAVFQSGIYRRHDRLHKLTSLSTNYREKILRKARRSAMSHRGRLSGKIFLHESLYLGKETRRSSEFAETEKTLKKRKRQLTVD